MRLFLLAVLATMAASPLAAQERAAPPAVSRDEAMTMPLDTLVDIVLRQTGRRVTSVTRPNYGSSAGLETISSLRDLAFATEPYAANVVGLCAANLIDVEFEYPGYRNNQSDTPVRAHQVRAELVYRVIGAIDPAAEVDRLSEDRKAEENHRCRESGPVIPSNYSDLQRPLFFSYQGDLRPERALLVLQRALAGQRGVMTCDRVECGNQTGALDGLDLDKLVYVHASPTGVGSPIGAVGERDRYRIEARFRLHADEHSAFYMTFAVEADISACCLGQDPILSIGPSRLSLGPISIPLT
jgi:hypothetical protein